MLLKDLGSHAVLALPVKTCSQLQDLLQSKNLGDFLTGFPYYNLFYSTSIILRVSRRKFSKFQNSVLVFKLPSYSKLTLELRAKPNEEKKKKASVKH